MERLWPALALDQLDDISQDAMFENMDATKKGKIKFDYWSYYLKRFEVNQSDKGWESLMSGPNVREIIPNKIKNPSQIHMYIVSDDSSSVCSIGSTIKIKNPSQIHRYSVSDYPRSKHSIELTIPGLPMSPNVSYYLRQSYRQRSTSSVGNQRNSDPIITDTLMKPPSISYLTRGLAKLNRKFSEIREAPASVTRTRISNLHTFITRSIDANRTLAKTESTRIISNSPKNRDIRSKKDIKNDEKKRLDRVSVKNSRERALQELKKGIEIVHEKKVEELKDTISKLRQENEEKVFKIESVQSERNVAAARCDGLSLEIERLKDQLLNVTPERDKLIEAGTVIKNLETQEFTTNMLHAEKAVTKAPQGKNQVQITKGRVVVKLKSAMMLVSLCKQKRKIKGVSLDSQDGKRTSCSFKGNNSNFKPFSRSLHKEDDSIKFHFKNYVVV